jgi:hypothetical protein
VHARAHHVVDRPLPLVADVTQRLQRVQCACACACVRAFMRARSCVRVRACACVGAHLQHGVERADGLVERARRRLPQVPARAGGRAAACARGCGCVRSCRWLHSRWTPVPQLGPAALPRLPLGPAALPWLPLGPTALPQLPLGPVAMPRLPLGPVALRRLQLAPVARAAWPMHRRGALVSAVRAAPRSNEVPARRRVLRGTHHNVWMRVLRVL